MAQELDTLRAPSAFAGFQDETQNLGEGIVGGFPSINYRGKVWSLRLRGEQYSFLRADDGTPLSYLDVIILGSSPFVSKSFYPPGEWSEDSSGAPVCTSVKGDAPDSGAPEPQATSCGICTHNEWKTLRTGKRGKECQDQKRLAILLRPEMTTAMLGAPLDEPVFLKVPPGSLAPLKTYGDSLVHRGLPPCSVITRISFNSKQLFQMEFKAIKALTNEEAPAVIAQIGDPRTKRILGLAPQLKALPVVESQIQIAPPSKKVIEAVTAAQDNLHKGEIEEAKRQQEKLIRAAAERVAAPQQGQAEPTSGTTSWEESNDELDQEVAKLLGDKISAMMK